MDNDLLHCSIDVAFMLGFNDHKKMCIQALK